jgi:hypothetical protein
MYKHLVNYTRPSQQRHIVRIIVIVPLYSLCSFLSIFFHDQQTYFAIIRDWYTLFLIHCHLFCARLIASLLTFSYEAYALYQFFALCIELANGWKNMESAFVGTQETTWPLPFCCFTLRPSGCVLLLDRVGLFNLNVR